MNGGSNNDNNFPHKLLLTDTKALRFYIAFANYSSANIKFSKPQLNIMVQLCIFIWITFRLTWISEIDGRNSKKILKRNKK